MRERRKKLKFCRKQNCKIRFNKKTKTDTRPTIKIKPFVLDQNWKEKPFTFSPQTFFFIMTFMILAFSYHLFYCVLEVDKTLTNRIKIEDMK